MGIHSNKSYKLLKIEHLSYSILMIENKIIQALYNTKFTNSKKDIFVSEIIANIYKNKLNKNLHLLLLCCCFITHNSVEFI